MTLTENHSMWTGRLYVDWASQVTVLCRYWDPYYYRRQQIRTNDGMNFVESVIWKGWMICWIHRTSSCFENNENFTLSHIYSRFSHLYLVMEIQIKDSKRRGGNWYHLFFRTILGCQKLFFFLFRVFHPFCLFILDFL